MIFNFFLHRLPVCVYSVYSVYVNGVATCSNLI